MEGAFYLMNEGGKFKGAVLTHVDDFTLAGNDDILKIVIEGIKTCINLSKVEEDKFRYTGLDEERQSHGITVSMDDDIESLAELKEIRRAYTDKQLTRYDMKEYRKISWLANSTKPNLYFIALQLLKKNNFATYY